MAGRRQAIIGTNAGILLIGPLGTNFSEILIEIYTFPFKEMHLQMSGKWRPFCLGGDELNDGLVGWVIASHVKQCIWLLAHTIISIDTLRLRQNGRHFPDDIFKAIFFNENYYILIKISLKFVLQCPINNIPALVQKMAWRRWGDKPLSESVMAKFNDAYMRVLGLN